MAHVVHSGVYGARKVNALRFKLGWVQCRSHKNGIGTCYVELVFSISGSRSAFGYFRGTKCRRTVFHSRLCPMWILAKARWDMLHCTCVFASDMICGSHSAFGCVRSTKC
jgi:hypothetical protein